MTDLSRITRPQMFMQIARIASQRSTCMRLNVGAVLVSGRSIVSIGYNGSPSGEPHCTGAGCATQSGCNRTIHAEDNALRHVPQGLSIDRGSLDLYVTDSPCAACYDKIVDDGRVGRIFFGTPYRITGHLENSLFETDVAVYRVLPSGFVIDWNSGGLVDVKT